MGYTRFHFLICFSGLSLLFSSIPASGQVVTATVYGAVLDQSGAVISGARIKATNAGTNATSAAATNEAGEFTIATLQAGVYSFAIEAAGFKALRRSGVNLASGERIRLNFTLEVGAVSERLEVTGETPLLNTVNAEQRSNVEEIRITELPIVRRDWTNLLGLSTGVQTTGGAVRLNGLAPASFRLTVDGTDATQDTEQPSFTMSGNFNFIKGVSTEAIAEVNLAKGIASAEIANTMSGNVNIHTKSGSNDLHGSLFHLHQNENLNSREQFLRNKPSLVYNQFGGSLGGPVVRNRLFFFGVYEGYRQRGFSTLSAPVPTKEFRDRVLARSPIYAKTFGVFPLPNQSYPPGATTGGFIGAGTQSSNDNHAVARMDWHAAGNTIVTGRYTRSRPDRINPRVVEVNSRSWIGTIEQGTLNVTRASSGWTSESRFGVNYNLVPRLDNIYTLYEQDNAFNGITGLGFSLDGETLTREGYSYSIEQIFGTTRGRHSLKMGGIFLQTAGKRANTEIPILTFANEADLIANIPSRGRVTIGIDEFKASTKTIGFFLQDDFKFSQNLVLNLGVRWDYYTVPKERDGRLFNRAQPFGTGSYLPPDEIWKADWNNFSPRIGFAYSLQESKTVIRGGAGIFHNPRTLFGGPVDLVRNSLVEPFRVEFSRQDAVNNAVFRWPVSNDAVRRFVRGPGGLIGDTAINNDFPYPLSYQWTLTVQRTLAGGFVLETGYVGTRGLNMMMVRFWNPPDRLTGVRPYAGFTEFRYRDAGEHTHFHSWQTTLRRRYSSGFLFNINYTFANSTSYTDQADLLLPGSVQDIHNVRADKGPPNEDVRHRFVSDFIYELPFARSSTSRVLKNVAAGWQAAGILNAQTGQPFTITQPSGLQSSRPDYIGGPALLDNPTETLLHINRAALGLVPLAPASGLPVRPGNIGRNALRQVGFWTMDVSFSKRFFVTERINLKFGVDLLNAFNHTNLSSLVTNINSGTFGRYQGTRGSRAVQLEMRLAF